MKGPKKIQLFFLFKVHGNRIKKIPEFLLDFENFFSEHFNFCHQCPKHRKNPLNVSAIAPEIIKKLEF